MFVAIKDGILKKIRVLEMPLLSVYRVDSNQITNVKLNQSKVTYEHCNFPLSQSYLHWDGRDPHLCICKKESSGIPILDLFRREAQNVWWDGLHII